MLLLSEPGHRSHNCRSAAAHVYETEENIRQKIEKVDMYKMQTKLRVQGHEIHKLALLFSRSRLRELFFAPSLPFPTSTEKLSKLTELPLPKLTFIAALVVKVSTCVKNFCSAVWADSALSSCSCCKTYKTATRAKSNTSSVTVKVAVGLAEAELAVEEPVNEAPEGADEISQMMPFVVDGVAAEFRCIFVESSSRLFPEDEVAEVAVGVTTSFAWLTRWDWPSNVTRAFSDEHDRLAELNRARIVFSERGIEKFVWAAEIRRDMESPMVTLFKSELESVVVVQPDEPAIEQVAPVKPFVHIHAQDPLSSTDDPPFWQAVVEFASHCWTGVKVAEAALGLRKTKNSRGMTTAAAMIIKSIKTTRRNPQHGSPQQRRRFFSLGWALGSRFPLDSG
jgi:hypothetical protein